LINKQTIHSLIWIGNSIFWEIQKLLHELTSYIYEGNSR